MDVLSCAYYIIGDRCLEPVTQPQSTDQDVEDVLELMREILIHG